MCVCFAGDLGCARREHRRGVRRGAFSTQRNFLATYIRQRQCFGLLRGAVALRPAVLLTVVAEAPLVTSARRAMAGRASVVATVIAAVVVAAIIPSADEERHDAPQATQLVNGNVGVQGSGCNRQKLGRGSAAWDE
jgi:hypothetical protein